MEQGLTREDFLDGKVLLINKPLEWTSFQAVNAVKWALKRKFALKKIKVGHAGTLDPLATGLLLICTGKATRQIAGLQAREKEYTGVITLGATTPSYDLETAIDKQYPTEHITEKAILEAARTLTGRIWQTPPVFSALKKDGKRLYELARQGEKTDIPPREVEIYEFEITAWKNKDISFRIRCSKGTYIRSLAFDFGRILGSGGHLTRLERTKIGEYHVNNSQSPHEFRESLLAI